MMGGVGQGGAGEVMCQMAQEFGFYSKWDGSHLKA